MNASIRCRRLFEGEDTVSDARAREAGRLRCGVFLALIIVLVS
jgi:hypothetical protein